jgi:hypothetical protein
MHVFLAFSEIIVFRDAQWGFTLWTRGSEDFWDYWTRGPASILDQWLQGPGNIDNRWLQGAAERRNYYD